MEHYRDPEWSAILPCDSKIVNLAFFDLSLECQIEGGPK